MKSGQSAHGGKRGSSVSDRQIAFSVKEGRKVRIHLGGASYILEGYVIGVDDYHWALIEVPFGPHSSSRVHLVHKSVPALTILNQTLNEESEEVRKALEPLIADFRGFVMREHFGVR